jgi:hypothetical protein
VAVPVGPGEVDAAADGVAGTVGLGTPVGMALAEEAPGVGFAGLGLPVRAGALLCAGAGALEWLP